MRKRFDDLLNGHLLLRVLLLWRLLLFDLSSVLSILRRLFNLQGVLNCDLLLFLLFLILVVGLLLVLELLLITSDLTLAELEVFQTCFALFILDDLGNVVKLGVCFLHEWEVILERVSSFIFSINQTQDTLILGSNLTLSQVFDRIRSGLLIRIEGAYK